MLPPPPKKKRNVAKAPLGHVVFLRPDNVQEVICGHEGRHRVVSGGLWVVIGEETGETEIMENIEEQFILVFNTFLETFEDGNPFVIFCWQVEELKPRDSLYVIYYVIT